MKSIIFSLIEFPKEGNKVHPIIDFFTKVLNTVRKKVGFFSPPVTLFTLCLFIDATKEVVCGKQTNNPNSYFTL